VAEILGLPIDNRNAPSARLAFPHRGTLGLFSSRLAELHLIVWLGRLAHQCGHDAPRGLQIAAIG
jgi:hypothetical protein